MMVEADKPVSPRNDGNTITSLATTAIAMSR
jgi:hypothetical protein